MDDIDLLEEPGSESSRIVRRIFRRAALRVGSVAALAREIGATYSEIRLYLSGEAAPPTELLLRVVEIVIEDLPDLKSGFSDHVWRELALPSPDGRAV